jgi:hypothetical protein
VISRRLLLRCGCGGGLALLVAGCADSPPVRTDAVAGRPGGRIASILADSTVLPAVRAAIPAYFGDRPRGSISRFATGGGSPADIATTVKHGFRVDAVVLPAGPSLDRVRDELVTAPVQIGELGTTAYWGAAVTVGALPFVRYLAGQGRHVLRAHGLT